MHVPTCWKYQVIDIGQVACSKRAPNCSEMGVWDLIWNCWRYLNWMDNWSWNGMKHFKHWGNLQKSGVVVQSMDWVSWKAYQGQLSILLLDKVKKLVKKDQVLVGERNDEEGQRRVQLDKKWMIFDKGSVETITHKNHKVMFRIDRILAEFGCVWGNRWKFGYVVHRNIWKFQKIVQSSVRSPESTQEMAMLRNLRIFWHGCTSVLNQDTHKLFYKFNKMVLITLEGAHSIWRSVVVLMGTLYLKVSTIGWIGSRKCQLLRVEQGY